MKQINFEKTAPAVLVVVAIALKNGKLGEWDLTSGYQTNRPSSIDNALCDAALLGWVELGDGYQLTETGNRILAAHKECTAELNFVWRVLQHSRMNEGTPQFAVEAWIQEGPETYERVIADDNFAWADLRFAMAESRDLEPRTLMLHILCQEVLDGNVPTNFQNGSNIDYDGIFTNLAAGVENSVFDNEPTLEMIKNDLLAINNRFGEVLRNLVERGNSDDEAMFPIANKYQSDAMYVSNCWYAIANAVPAM